MHKLLLYIYFTFFLQPDAFSQIRLENPSFEGDPQDATVPVGWFPCEEGSTPDLLPGPWAVYQTPSDGQSFMGLITREDGTWESVGQQTSQPMQNGQCYYMDINLAFSVPMPDTTNPSNLESGVDIAVVKSRYCWVILLRSIILTGEHTVSFLHQINPSTISFLKHIIPIPRIIFTKEIFS